jgi:hypothetical protein
MLIRKLPQGTPYFWLQPYEDCQIRGWTKSPLIVAKIRNARTQFPRCDDRSTNNVTCLQSIDVLVWKSCNNDGASILQLSQTISLRVAAPAVQGM